MRYIELNEEVSYDEKCESVSLSDLWNYNTFRGNDMVCLRMHKSEWQ